MNKIYIEKQFQSSKKYQISNHKATMINLIYNSICLLLVCFAYIKYLLIFDYKFREESYF